MKSPLRRSRKRDGHFNGELKVSEALGRTRKKSPRQRRREAGPRTSQNTTSKCPALVPRAGAKDFPVMHPGGSDGGGLSSQCSSSCERKAEGSQVGRTREEVVSAQAHLSVQEEAGVFPAQVRARKRCQLGRHSWDCHSRQGWDQPR